EPAEALLGLGDRPRAFFIDGDVRDDRSGATPGARDLGHGALGRLWITVKDSDARSVSGKRPCDGPTDRSRPTVTPAATGDERPASAHPLRAQRSVDVDSHVASG